MGEAKILEFPKPAAPTGDLILIEGEGRACAHRAGLTVDEKGREVFCSRCGEALDPFDALIGLSRRQHAIRDAEARAREKGEKAQARTASLERMEKNAKGRAWRALLKMPAAEVVLAFAVQSSAQKYGTASLDLLRKHVGDALEELKTKAPKVD